MKVFEADWGWVVKSVNGRFTSMVGMLVGVLDG